MGIWEGMRIAHQNDRSHMACLYLSNATRALGKHQQEIDSEQIGRGQNWDDKGRTTVSEHGFREGRREVLKLDQKNLKLKRE